MTRCHPQAAFALRANGFKPQRIVISSAGLGHILQAAMASACMYRYVTSRTISNCQSDLLISDQFVAFNAVFAWRHQLHKLRSTDTTYHVQLCYNGGQRARRKSQLLIASIAPKYETKEDVPTHLSLLSIRAKASEKCRMRCINADCPHRPPEERDAAAIAMDDPIQELQPDDLEATGVDDLLEEDNQEKEEEEIIPAPIPQRKCVRDLWPFATSIGYQTGLFQAFSSKDPTLHMVHLTRSAHPAPLLAANNLGKQCHVLVCGQSKHSCAHGKELLKDYIFNEFYQKEKATLDPANRKADWSLRAGFSGWSDICIPRTRLFFEIQIAIIEYY